MTSLAQARALDMLRSQGWSVVWSEFQSRGSDSYGKGWKAHFRPTGRELRRGKVNSRWEPDRGSFRYKSHLISPKSTRSAITSVSTGAYRSE